MAAHRPSRRAGVVMASFEWSPGWRARWIWAGDPSPAPGAPPSDRGASPRETWDRFCYLRREFTLDAVPRQAPARVTADSRFILYVNGREVVRGPARSLPERLAYAELDLAPYLRPGANAIAALVRYYGRPGPWWVPATPNGQLGFGSFAFESLAIGVVSDESWQGAPAPYRRMEYREGAPFRMTQPPSEVLDGGAVPHGWTEPGFDGSAWAPATALAGGRLASHLRIPVEPYAAMEPDEIAPLTADPIAFTEAGSLRLAAAEDDDPIAAFQRGKSDRNDAVVCTTYDAGGVVLATPWIEVRGAAGAIVDLIAGEELNADGAVEPRPRHYALRYRLGGVGTERFEGFDAAGFRYLSAVVRGDAEIVAIGATERRYPRPDGAAFACDDERINAIWAAGARTLEVCATDAFIDCPGREQRAWLGDAYIHALLTFTTNPDWRLAGRHLRICAASRRSDGLLTMVAAGDLALVATTIPDYSLHWLRALARYFEYSGDAATVRELLPVAGEILAWFERFREAGGLLRGVPGWVFVDWAMTERHEGIAALDALYIAALADYAALLDAATSDARAYAVALDRLDQSRDAFEHFWDDARGVYVDAADEHGPRRRVSQQTNALAIVAGCAPPERYPRILAHILDEERVRVTPVDAIMRLGMAGQALDPAEHCEFDAEGSVVAAQPFFAHFLHQALAIAGRRDLLADRCLRWWPQIEAGHRTIGEFWQGPSGFASQAHAWSCTPTYDLTAHLLGVKPLSPGYARAAIRPYFGRLEHLSGRVPTPLGFITLDLSREDGAITIPDGMTAEVQFDDAPLPAGTLAAGTHRLAVHT